MYFGLITENISGIEIRIFLIKLKYSQGKKFYKLNLKHANSDYEL